MSPSLVCRSDVEREEYLVRCQGWNVVTAGTLSHHVRIGWTPSRSGIWDLAASVRAQDHAHPFTVRLYRGDSPVLHEPDRGRLERTGFVLLTWDLSLPVVSGVPEAWSIRFEAPVGYWIYRVEDGIIHAREQR